MGKRLYNTLFHLHTVSGIVISVLLYVIFFTGSFSFFRDEIISWERSESVSPDQEIQMDYDLMFDTLSTRFDLYGRDFTMSQPHAVRRVTFDVTASKDTLAKENNKAKFFYLDPKSGAEYDYYGSYTLGEFLYRLHFFAQVPYPVGYFLSGFTALFFLFAILTGVLVHWKKIISNFYLFRPWSKLKTMWTDAHTALGMIGLPFQFVYAVTGAFFMIKLLLVAPVVLALYGGDQAALYEDLEYSSLQYEFTNQKLTEKVSINELVNQASAQWEDFSVTKVQVLNYGDSNMHVVCEGVLDVQKKLLSQGKVVYSVVDGREVIVKNPEEQTSYLDAVKQGMFTLHYGDYGGYALRIISFVFGLVTCFVIISGVMIWLTARNKNNVPEKKRRFNEKVVRIYLAISLSMYPITALTFVAVKLINPAGQVFLYTFYFVGWFLLTIFFITKKSNYFTNKYTLLSGSVLGIMIPVVNGVASGNWFWITFRNQAYDVCFVDVFWIVLASTIAWVALRLKKPVNTLKGN